MTPFIAALSPAVSPAQTLAGHLATLLPTRAGSPWTVEPFRAWWSTSPAARLVQGPRALVLVARPWDTEIGWQLPGREPYRPDTTLETLAPARIAREVLRLVLPVLDDEAARTREDGSRARLEMLYEIGNAMRAQGAATYERASLLVNTSSVTWASNGLRYSATLLGTNPVCDVQIQGPVRAVGIRGRLRRRVAQLLARHGHVEQAEKGGLAFGTGHGPYGYVAPHPAPATHDTTSASANSHGVGVDFLVSLAPRLAN
ncbi:hypothetical protein [Streptomyces sp. NPDC059455]|uniref:hypothetical protein n=1 Tax=Streptomyces sp. NPDC059455 TaxID=3346837 RepID=UPI0036870906